LNYFLFSEDASLLVIVLTASRAVDLKLNAGKCEAFPFGSVAGAGN